MFRAKAAAGLVLAGIAMCGTALVSAHQLTDGPHWGNEAYPIRITSTNDYSNGNFPEVTYFGNTSVSIGSVNPNTAVAVRFTAPSDCSITKIKMYFMDSTVSEPSWRVYLATGTPNGTSPNDFEFALGIGATNYMAYWNDDPTAESGDRNNGWWGCTVSGATGNSSIKGGSVYWLIFSSRTAPTTLGGVFPAGFVGDSAHQPNKAWQKFGSSNTLTDLQQACYYCLDTNADPDVWGNSGASQQGLITPLIVIETTDGQISMMMDIGNNQQAINSSNSKRTTFLCPPGGLKIDAVNVMVYKNATAPTGPLTLELYNRTTGNILSTATIHVSEIPAGTQYNDAQSITKGFVPPVTISDADSSVGYALIWSNLSSGNNYYIHDFRPARNGFDLDATFQADLPSTDIGLGQTKAPGTRATDTGWTDYIGADFPFYLIRDIVPPTIAITLPVNNTWRKSISKITGTAADNIYVSSTNYHLLPSSGAWLFIYDKSNSTRWTKAGWTGYDAGDENDYANWVATGVTNGNWVYGSGTWTNKHEYTIYSAALDYAGNYSTVRSTITFRYDTEAPVSAPSFPSTTLSPPTWYGNSAGLPQLSGSVLDNANGCVYRVRWMLWRASDGKYWDGAWQTGPVPVVVDYNSWNPSVLSPGMVYNPDSWSKADMLPVAGDLDQGNTYYVSSFAVDRVTNDAGTNAPNYQIARTTCAFRWDTGVPVSTITYPATASLIPATPDPFTGVMGDPLSGIAPAAGVQVSFQNKSSGEYWRTGVGWVGSSWWNEASYSVDKGTWAWSYPGSPLSSADYIIVSRAKDDAGNYQATFTQGDSSNTVSVDATSPASALTKPSMDDLYYKNITSVGGNAADNMAGANIFVQIQDLTRGTTYWSQATSQWVNYSTWSAIGWSTSWSMTTGNIYTSGNQYRVKCYAKDQANNSEGVPGDTAGARTKYFYYDATVPQSAVTVPTNLTILSAQPTITGTCNNDAPPAGKSISAGMGAGKIEVLISKGGDALFWNNTTKSWGAQVWNDAAQIGGVWSNWELLLSSPTALDNGVAYAIRSRATDGALDETTMAIYSGNREFNGTLVGSSVTVTYDSQPPTSHITVPSAAENRVASLGTIAGTVADNVAVRAAGGLDINICENVGGPPYKAWDGGAWVNMANQTAQENAWVPIENFALGYNYTAYQTSGTWWVRITTNTSSDGQTYRIRSRARDRGYKPGQDGTPEVILSTRTVVFDISAPVSVLTTPVPGGYINTVPLTTIAGTCSGTPDVPAMVSVMQVQLYYRDVGGSTWTWKHSVNTWSNEDPIWFSASSLDGGTPAQNWGYTNAQLNWVSDTQFYVNLKVSDEAGNTQTPTLYNFWYDVTRPTTTITAPGGGVVSSLTSLSGFAGDKTAGFAGVAGDNSVQIRIQDLARGATWWNWAGGWTNDPDSWSNADWYTGAGLNLTEWQKTTGLPSWTSDNNYQIQVRANDRSGNWSAVYSSVTFRVDQNPPDTTILVPGVSSLKMNLDNTNQTLATISGTAADGSSNLSRVEVRLRDLSTANTYWWALGTSGYWAVGSSWAVAAGGSGVSPASWNYAVALSSFVDGRTYSIEARGVDAPGNIDASPAIKTSLLVDYTRPLSTVVVPAAGQIVKKGFVGISGTTADPAGPGGGSSGLNRVEQRLRRVSTPEAFWDGSAWSETEPADYPDVVIGGDLTWSYVFAGTGSWTNGTAYELTSRAVDNSKKPSEITGTGNEEWTVGAPPTLRIFYFDDAPPQSIITNAPAAGYTNSYPSVAGTASDNMRVEAVAVHVYSITDNKTWNGTSWASSPSGDLLTDTYWHDASFVGNSSGTFSYACSWNHNVQYRIVSRAVDAAQNYQMTLSTFTFAYDQYAADPEKPDSTITLPAESQHFSVKFSSVTGSASDNLRGALNAVRVRVRLLPSAHLGESTTYYWSNVAQDWVSADPGVGDWAPAAAADGAFDANADDWYCALPQSGQGALNFWKAGHRYDAFSAAQDKAGNWELACATVTFAYEANIPTAAIVYPVNSGYITSAGYIEGTCADMYPGVVEDVFVRIREGSSYWRVSDATWAGDQNIWNSVIASGTLSASGTWWQLRTAPWQSGKTYTIDAWARDRAGNAQVYFSTCANVKADFTAPSSSVTYPTESADINGYYTDLPTISGTLSDNFTQDLDQYQLKLQIRYGGGARTAGSGESSPTEWWTGSTWTAVEYYVPVASITIQPGWSLGGWATWYFDNGASPSACNDIWRSKGNEIWFDIRLYAVDKAGNTQSFGADGVDLYYKVPYGNATMSQPPYESAAPNVYHSQTAYGQILGQADNYTESVKISIRQESDGYYWYGSSFSAGPEHWLDTAYTQGAGLSPWTYNFSGTWNVNLSSYTVRAKAVNIAGENTYDPDGGGPLNGNIFIVDQALPASAITAPGAMNYYRAFTQVAGTAGDLPSGTLGTVVTVGAAIKKTVGADHFYWNVAVSSWAQGGAAPVAVNFNTTTWNGSSKPDGSTWQMALSSNAWTDGTLYTLYSQATDKAGNKQSPYTQASFYFDVSTPVAQVTTLTNNAVYSSLSQIQGTSNDPAGPGGNTGKLDRVDVMIKKNDTIPFYWTGSGWSADVSWATTTVHVAGVADSSWTCVALPGAAEWSHGFTYTIAARAKDTSLAAGNTQQIFTVGASSFNIVWDNQAPAAAVTTPHHNDKIAPQGASWSIFGTVDDSPAGSTMANIKLELSRLSGADTYYWDGAGAWFLNTPKEFSPIGYAGNVWQYNMPVVNLVSDQQYSIRVRATDLAAPANVGAFPTETGAGFVQVIVDTTPPVSVVAFPRQGGYYRSADLGTLSGTANGDRAGISRVTTEIRRFDDPNWTVVRPFGAAERSGTYGTIAWSTGTAGLAWTSGSQYAVESRAYDFAGSTQVVVSSVTFVVDDGAPTLSVTTPQDLSSWAVLSVASGTFSDAISAVSTVTVAIQKITAPTGWWNGSDFTGGARQDFAASTAAPNSWSYSGFQAALADNSKYTFFVKAMDAAGNPSSETARTVTIDTAAPSAVFQGLIEGHYYQALTAVSGSASDPNANASRAAGIELRIHDVAANKDWDPGVANWGGVGAIIRFTSAYTPAEPLSWSWDASGVTWVDGNRYLLELRARDQALKSNDGSFTGNWQVDYTTVSFSVDRTTPTYTVAYPAGLKYNAVGNIRGSYTETTSGIKTLQIVVKGDYAGGLYWDEPTLSWKNQTDLTALGRWPPWTDVSVYQSSWAHTTAINYLPNNSRTHKIWTKVVDGAGNARSATTQNIIDSINHDVSYMYDSEQPISYIGSISEGQALNTPLSSITGTATDVNFGAGVSDLKVRVMRDDGLFWQESGWGAAVQLSKFSLSGAGMIKSWEWRTAYPNDLWEDNHTYGVNAIAYDEATNSELQFSTVTVTFDATPPTSAVTFPPIAGSGYAGAVSAILGTANDANVRASKVAAASVAVQRKSDNLWWGGWSNQNWIASTPPVFSTATLTATYVSSVTWIYSFTPAQWSNSTSYWILSRAQDRAGNYEAQWTTATFICDTSAPVSSVTVPTSAMYDSLPTISGTAADGSGGQIKNVRIRIYCSDPLAPEAVRYKYWTGTEWSSTPEWLDTAFNAGGWTYNAGSIVWEAREDPGYQYKIWALAQDMADNYETVSGTTTFAFASPLPTTNLTAPAFNAYYKAAAAMTFMGTANAFTKNAQGGVDLRVSSGPAYTLDWNETTKAWVAAPYYNAAALTEGDPGTWMLDISSIAWTDGGQFLTQSRGHGPAGPEVAIEDVYFYVDRTVPSGTVGAPAANTHHQSVTAISGTSADTAPGIIDRVDVQISKFINPTMYYYNGFSWQTDTVWLVAAPNDGSFNSAGEAWTYTVQYPTECWKDQQAHTIKMRTYDKSLAGGNLFTSAGMDIIIDKTAPASGLTTPSLALHNSVPAVAGTASDTAPGMPREIQMSVINNDTGKHWTGTGWSATGGLWRTSSLDTNFTTWFAVNPGTWTYSGVTWDPGYQYTVQTSAVDHAGKQETPGAGVTFTFDNEKPVSAVAVPSAGARTSALSVIEGTADDATVAVWASGVSTASVVGNGVNVALFDGTSYYSGGGVWNDAAVKWFATEYSSTTKIWRTDTGDLGTFTMSGNPVDGMYQIIARARDNAGNYETAYATRPFVWDCTRPVSFASVPSSGSYVPDLAGGISGTAADATAGMERVIVNFWHTNGSDYYWTGSSWTTTAYDLVITTSGGTGTMPWALAVTTGLVQGVQYSVRSRAVDQAGNQEASPRTITFRCDRTGPLVAVTTPTAGGNYGPARPLTAITGTASDTPSGVSRTELYIQNFTDTTRWNGVAWVGVAVDTWIAAAGTTQWQAAAPAWPVNKVFKVQARTYDQAGNVTTLSPVTFIYDSTAPVSGLSEPNAPYENGTLTAISGTSGEPDPDPVVRSGYAKTLVAILSGANYLQAPPSDFSGDEKWFEVTGSPWNFTSTPTWVNGVAYEVRSKAVDTAGNEQSPASSYSFTFDSMVGVSSVTSFLNGQPYNAFAGISGTAADDVSGVRQVDLALCDVNVLTSRGYWNPATGLFDQNNGIWGRATGTTAWSVVSSSFAALVSGHTYRVLSRVTDNAANVPADPDWNADRFTFGISFKYDNTPPVSITTAPAAGAYLTAPFTGMFGTANDTATGSGISAVRFTIQRSDGKWYTGDTEPWDVNFPGWFMATAGAGTLVNWYATLAASPWVDGYQYSIVTKASDNALNNEVNLSTVTFIFDQTPPASRVAAPAHATWLNTLPQITGTANDPTIVAGGHPSDVSKVELSVLRHSDGKYWDGVSAFADGVVWSTAALTQTAVSSYTWTYPFSNAYWTNHTSYTVVCRAVDNAGLLAYGSTSYFIFDTSAPVSAITTPVSSPPALTELLSITGTSADIAPGRMTAVHIQLEHPDDGLFWTGSGWGGQPG